MYLVGSEPLLLSCSGLWMGADISWCALDALLFPDGLWMVAIIS